MMKVNYETPGLNGVQAFSLFISSLLARAFSYGIVWILAATLNPRIDTSEVWMLAILYGEIMSAFTGNTFRIGMLLKRK
jgi:hypothetical protein